MGKIELPDWAKTATENDTFYVLCDPEKSGEIEAWKDINGIDDHPIISGCLYGAFVPIEHSDIFVRSLDFLAAELAAKGWKEEKSGFWVLAVDGYRDYYFGFNPERKRWELSQWGMYLNILVSDHITDKVITRIFALCSQYAKKMPW